MRDRGGAAAALAAATAAALRPAAALAHAPAAGMPGFYSGLLHPALTAAHVLALLGLGLLLAPLWPDRFARAWAGFAAAAAVGLSSAVAAAPFALPAPTVEAAALLLALGAALAVERPAVLLVPAVLAGLLLGADSAPDPGPAGPVAATAAGGFLGLNLGLLYVAGAAGWLRRRFPQRWAVTALRIAAAWVAAVACLLAALAAAPPPA